MTQTWLEPEMPADEATASQAPIQSTTPGWQQYVRGSARWRDLSPREMLDALDWDDLPPAPLSMRPVAPYALNCVVAAPTLAERCTLTFRMAFVTFALFVALGFLLGTVGT